jgi:anti-anti-sigma factor
MSFEGGTNFSLRESAGAEGVRIELVGELDLSVAGRLRDRLDELAQPGAKVVLDLSQLDFIDSSGINVIVTYHRQASQDGWTLLVEKQMTLSVRRVINVMGLDALFWPRPTAPES